MGGPPGGGEAAVPLDPDTRLSATGLLTLDPADLITGQHGSTGVSRPRERAVELSSAQAKYGAAAR